MKRYSWRSKNAEANRDYAIKEVIRIFREFESMQKEERRDVV
jgi:hypothetical protein